MLTVTLDKGHLDEGEQLPLLPGPHRRQFGELFNRETELQTFLHRHVDDLHQKVFAVLNADGVVSITHKGSPSLNGRENPFGFKLLIGLAYGVAAHLETFGQFSFRRKFVARLPMSVPDLCEDGLLDLYVQGDAVLVTMGKDI